MQQVNDKKLEKNIISDNHKLMNNNKLVISFIGEESLSICKEKKNIN